MPQVINYVASMFPSLPKSAITDALGKAGGNVDYALDALLMAKVIPGRIMPSRALVEQASWQGRTPAQDSPMPLINGSESLVSRTAFQQPCITQARLLKHMQVGPLLLLRLSFGVCLLLFVVRFR